MRARVLNVVAVHWGVRTLIWYGDRRDLEESLMLLHSYVLVKLLVKQGDHDTGVNSHPIPRSSLCIPPRSFLHSLVREQARRRSQRATGAKSRGHACRARMPCTHAVLVLGAPQHSEGANASRAAMPMGERAKRAPTCRSAWHAKCPRQRRDAAGIQWLIQ